MRFTNKINTPPEPTEKGLHGKFKGTKILQHIRCSFFLNLFIN